MEAWGEGWGQGEEKLLVNFAVMKDVPTFPRNEESVLGMEQHGVRRLAIMTVALTMLSKEEYA